jgi:hypothetical protein
MFLISYPKCHISNLMEEKLAEGPAHCICNGGHAPSHLLTQATTTNEEEKWRVRV